MENCKNCFLAASCAATADPKISNEERKLVDTALIAQYSDENKRLKEMLYQASFWLREYPRCGLCANVGTVSCDNCGRHYANFKLFFADEYDKIMLRE